MVDDEDHPRKVVAHAIGEKLDTLSIRDFDDRIALLREEILRLETARRQKQDALDLAGSLFKTVRPDP